MATRMTPVQRKLPGDPIPRQEIVRGYNDWHQQNLLAGPGKAVLFDLLVSKPEDSCQWRIELDCGCIRDVVTHGDSLETLLARSDEYHFRIQRPSQREIDEDQDRINREVNENATARFKGEQAPVRPERPSLQGKQRLPAGQWLCEFCPKNRSESQPAGPKGPVRDIVEWVRRRDDLYTMEPVEVDGEKIGRAMTYEVWDVVLDCGHFRQELVEPGWKLEDGFRPKRPPKGKFRGLKDTLRVVCNDADDEAYWRRLYAEKHPDPVPFTQCRTCANLRTVVAYERVGWVAPKPKPPKAPPPPKPPSRRSLQSKLGKLEAEVARIRKQLEQLEDRD